MPQQLPPPASQPHVPGALRRLAGASQALRHGVQAGFLLLCLWIGVEFVSFMHWAEGGRAAFAAHPAGAEGFLPISALLSLKYALLTGRIHGFHPAGLFIFLAILGIGLLLSKGFCSWLCPVGTLSEALGRLGRAWFGRHRTLPRALDYPLRGLKYLILGLFLWVVGRMDGPGLEAFLDSPFNALADVRMYLFFVHLSGLAGVVIGVLAALSLLVQNLWCRYLCPYGALLGLLSLASPLRITRTPAHCIDCGGCTRACPSRIQVHQAGRVASDECSACYRCVAACPVPEALQMRAPGRKAVPGWGFALLVTGLFLAVTGLAMALGHWNTRLTPQDYRYLVPATEAEGARP